METSNLQLTPEMRAALSASPGGLVHIADKETGKVYLLFEQGDFPELEDEYVREGLQLAREQIARGEVSTAAIEEVIAKAQQRQPAKS
jgi:Arc/MetJ-type ribon-helix-helix transcriptional regulator